MKDPTQNICNTSRAYSDSRALTVINHYCECILLQQILMFKIRYDTALKTPTKINTFILLNLDPFSYSFNCHIVQYVPKTNF